MTNMVENAAMRAPRVPMCGYQIAREIGGRNMMKDIRMFWKSESWIPLLSSDEILLIPWVIPWYSSKICWRKRPKRRVLTVSSWQRMQERIKVASLSSEENILRQFSSSMLTEGRYSANSDPVKPYTPVTPITLYVRNTKRKPKKMFLVLCSGYLAF